jgi:hypothetical protein
VALYPHGLCPLINSPHRLCHPMRWKKSAY